MAVEFLDQAEESQILGGVEFLDEDIPSGIPVEDSLRQRTIADIRRPLAEQISGAIGAIPGVVGELAQIPIRGVQGAYQLGQEAALAGGLDLSRYPGEVGRRLAQTGLEIGTRIPYDVADIGTQLAGRMAEVAETRPELLRAFLPQLLGLPSVFETGAEPTEAALERAMERRRLTSALGEERQQGVAPELFGVPAQQELTELGLLAVPVTAGAPTVARMATLAGRRIATRSAAKKAATFRGQYTDIVNPTTLAQEERLRKAVETGQAQNTASIILRESGQRPESLESGISAGNKARQNFSKQVDEFAQANKNVKFVTNEASQDVRSVLRGRERDIEQNPQLVEEIEKRAKALERSFEPRQLLDRLNSILDSLGNYWKRSAEGQTTFADDILNQADIAEHAALSRITDRVMQGTTGLAENPFRLYGQVGEFVKAAEVRLTRLGTKEAREGVKGAIGEQLERAEITKPGIIRGIVRTVRGGEKGRVNRSVRDLFMEARKAPPARKLTEAERAEFLRQRVEVPPLLETGFEQRAGALAQQAQASRRTLPMSERIDTELALLREQQQVAQQLDIQQQAQRLAEQAQASRRGPTRPELIAGARIADQQAIELQAQALAQEAQASRRGLTRGQIDVEALFEAARLGDPAAMQRLRSIFQNIEGRAEGGPVVAGQTFVAGEEGPETFVSPQGVQPIGVRGPELFSATGSGYIIPNKPQQTTIGSIADTLASILTLGKYGVSSGDILKSVLDPSIPSPQPTAVSDIAEALAAVLTRGPGALSTEALRQSLEPITYPSLE